MFNRLLAWRTVSVHINRAAKYAPLRRQRRAHPLHRAGGNQYHQTGGRDRTSVARIKMDIPTRITGRRPSGRKSGHKTAVRHRKSADKRHYALHRPFTDIEIARHIGNSGI